MPKVIIDDVEHEFEDGTNLIQACEMAGKEIPRFCYHERLSIAGNCRMCLVEVVGAPKPVASCAQSVNDLRPGPNGEPPVIRTNSELVKEAREGVMEFLLINHPLDCPICDQGGECDLQDQAMAYGVDTSRFAENKRAVEDKNIGPLIKTIMTRCILCTRCVRFATEVAGVSELGLAGRGEDAEITTYLEKGMESELSGNVIDLCPVGALTSKPYAYEARPWELSKTESIDVMDAVGSNIRVDSRSREVMRIMPRNHDGVNEEWISDKTRFIWDGLKTQRLDQPYVRRDGQLQPSTWDEALKAAAGALTNFQHDEIGFFAGDLAGAEEMFAMKQLADTLDVPFVECRQDGAALDPSLGRASYLFNATIEGIEEADAILLIGADPRLEASVMNARIRKRWLTGGLKIGVIGGQPDLTYDYQYLGAGSDTLSELADAKGEFSSVLQDAERPLIVVGQAALRGDAGGDVLALAAKLAVASGAVSEEWNGFCVLHTAAARVAGLDLGLVPGAGAKSVDQLKVAYLLGADEMDLDALGNAFVVYQGSHGDRGAHRADVILPGAAFSEKSAIYVNTEGRPQMGQMAVFPPGEAKEDWTIFRALSDVIGKPLAFDDLAALRKAMFAAAPHLAALDSVEAADAASVTSLGNAAPRSVSGSFDMEQRDFYLTNPIARASAVMAELSALKKARDGATVQDAAE